MDYFGKHQLHLEQLQRYLQAGGYTQVWWSWVGSGQELDPDFVIYSQISPLIPILSAVLVPGVLLVGLGPLNWDLGPLNWGLGPSNWGFRTPKLGSGTLKLTWLL